MMKKKIFEIEMALFIYDVRPLENMATMNRLPDQDPAFFIPARISWAVQSLDIDRIFVRG